jgi:hypothetical protein
MNIDQLGREYNIDSTAIEVVRLTKEVSGKDLDFRLFINLNTDGATMIARERMPKHILKIKENNTVRINHIIVHECAHILRLMKADPADRVVPSSNQATRNLAYYALKEELGELPVAARSNLFELWSAGLVNQLVNLPVDARIERWICNNYPSFRETQRKSLTYDVQNCLAGLSDNVRDNTIKTVFKKSNAMIYAYLKSLSQITGEDYTVEFKNYPSIKKTGRKLYACLDNEDSGFTQDIKTISAWAEILEVTGWFTWLGFEDVPESYYEHS